MCSNICWTGLWWMYLKLLKDILIITNETTINPMFKSIIMITNFLKDVNYLFYVRRRRYMQNKTMSLTLLHDYII